MNHTELKSGEANGGLFERRIVVRLSIVAALAALDVLLVAGCLLVVHQNLNLRTAISAYLTDLTPAEGSVAPPLDGKDWAGREQTVAYHHDARPTLVYTFTQHCPHCQENWLAMRSLQALVPQRLRSVYVDRVDRLTSDYLAANGIGDSVVFFRLSPVPALAYEARLVPQLELLDRDGTVQWSHAGELTPADVARAQAMIESDQSQ